LVAVLALAACGDDSGGGASDESGSESAEHSGDSTTTETPASSTTAALTPEEEVLRDYQLATDAGIAASNPPNPEHPDLVRYWGDDALALSQSDIGQWQGLGIGMISEVEVDAAVVTLTGDTAVVRDCFTDTTRSIELATGETSEPGSTTQLVEVSLERRDGIWVAVHQEMLADSCDGPT